MGMVDVHLTPEDEQGVELDRFDEDCHLRDAALRRGGG